MAPRSTFVPDPNLAAGLLRSEELRRWLEGRLVEAKANAEGRVPVRFGYIKQSIETEVGFFRGGLIGRLRAMDFKSPWVEYGTYRERARPFLRPGLDEAVPGAEWGER